MRLIARFATYVSAAVMSISAGGAALAAGGADYLHETRRVDWSFGGMLGGYDQAQLQRGFQVFREVCSACHSLDFIAFRNLTDEGGPHFSEAQIKSLAAEYEVTDGPNEDGDMFERPATLPDYWPSPYANSKQAAASNNGAVPPDLSLIAKARAPYSKREQAIISDLISMSSDIVTQYQEGGADYVYSLLTGYTDEVPASAHPEDYPDSHFNPYFVNGNGWIAMASPLSEGLVEYSDGSPETVDQYARDVSAFLMWTAEPHLESRKQSGLIVIGFLIIFSLMLFASKKRVWSSVH